MASGIANVKSYNRELCELIRTDKAKPSFVISHRLALEQAPDAYAHFDKHEKGRTKVVLRPGM